jgi:ribonuclease P protein component
MGAGKGYETHISAQQDQARTYAWIPCPHGDESRASRHKAPPRKRPRTADAVTRQTSATTTSKNSGLISSQGNRFARLGLAISKKHCRKATARNRIKRIIRESFRQQQALLAGLDVVVINQPGATRATSREISDSLDKHWQRCSKAKASDLRKDG